MVLDSKKIEKSCSFYVSDFHLEMMLLPYINKKIDSKENVEILTEKNLEETLKILVSKTNLKEENKEKILNLGWNIEKKEIKENSNIIIIGSENFIKEKNKEIQNINVESIVDCYNFEEVKDNIINIKDCYENQLNTIGNNKF